ncbi:hypothetical protein Back11_36280 [Paenibacillus baekrokdamisoli]|uniref:Uncharacterized protein n=1 Tax=Paenibacillus baekrokdamisoli TaxID=1712516 RepID=A0A3G9JBI2_9BACL|nr:hypothetical protein [Paenibacillus baekrokdamisoli]MBB3070775.1 hypothetical protein [Paenibacillus baekrokdamisoli]BBH22283.1 hypothetical protein Back11_36280 [Paenibacillus baekrokdamisoli]
MFDPTVFDNLKVAMENQVYDLDNLDGKIHITNRIDRMELSVMARVFALQFTLVEQKGVTAEIRLEASLKDLAAELLEQPGETPACTLRLRFYRQIEDVEKQCKQIETIIKGIWQPELQAKQTISFVYGQYPASYNLTVELKFNRKISEDQMDDIPDLLQHVLRTLRELGGE